MPILEGLDEISSPGRTTAIMRLNDALSPGERLVLTCRTEQYLEAVQSVDYGAVTLRGAAAVQLRPVDVDAVAAYLQAGAGPAAAARWDRVVSILGTERPAGLALTTLLMVSLAYDIYSPRNRSRTDEVREPVELLGPAMVDRSTVEQHLFDAFIPTSYEANPGRWPGRKTEAWLVFLARHLNHMIDGSDLAWWQLRQSVPFTALGKQAPFVFGLGFILSLSLGLALGLTSGLAIGLACGIGFAVGVVFSFPGLGWGVSRSAGVGNLAEVPNPRALLARARVGGLVSTVILVIACALVLWMLLALIIAALAMVQMRMGHTLGFGHYWISFAFGRSGQTAALALLAFGIGIGYGYSLTALEWPIYLISRTTLALRRCLPLSFMGFLSDAHRRGILIQVGAVYQFRHLEFQRRLATRPDPPHSPLAVQLSPQPPRQTRALRHSELLHTEIVRDLAFSPDGTLLATVCNDWTARFWTWIPEPS